MNATPETQLQLWNEAVQLLGGQRPVARALDCGERTIRALCSGERDLHSGWLEDISRLLIAHAEKCRRAERKLSPGFRANLTDDQAEAKPRRDWHQMKGADSEQG